jgi:midasin
MALICAPPTMQALINVLPQSPGPGYVRFDHYWVEAGELEPMAQGADEGTFVVTPTVAGHLRNLARAVLLRRYPILLQARPGGSLPLLNVHLAPWTAGQQPVASLCSATLLARYSFVR